MTPFKEVEDAFRVAAGFDLRPHTVYACYVGSKAHGTHVPSDDPESIDDIDILAIVLPPPAAVLGLNPWKESEHLQVGEWDLVVHSLAKFTRLLLKGNPNTLAALWVRPEDQLFCSSVFRSSYLWEKRAFSAKAAHDSFAGYAKQQLQKMAASENAYQGYMGEKRKKLVDRFGYDTKNAAHLIRLSLMGIEFLQTGEVTVYRTNDAELLRDIKQGKRSRAEVEELARHLSEEAVKALATSPLPDQPDAVAAERLLMYFYAVEWGVKNPDPDYYDESWPRVEDQGIVE